MRDNRHVGNLFSIHGSGHGQVQPSNHPHIDSRRPLSKKEVSHGETQEDVLRYIPLRKRVDFDFELEFGS